MKKLSIGISIVIILSMLLSLLTPVLADDNANAVEEPEATVEEAAVETEEAVEPEAAVEAEPAVEPEAAVEETAEEAEVSGEQGFIVIKATDFDSGVYQENDASAGSHDIRPDEDVQTEVGESAFGGNIGWTDSGEWVQYTVNVEKAGSYSAYVQAASGGSGGGIEVYYNDALIGTADVPATGGWQAYQIFGVGTVDMAAGENVIKVAFPNGGVNFSAMFFIEATDANPYIEHFIAGGTSTIEAVEFDYDDYNEFTASQAEEGNWTWYFDARDAGTNYAYRTEYQENQNGPQTENAEVPGLGEIGAICYTAGAGEDYDAEWVQYTVNVLKDGQYALSTWAGSGSNDAYIDIYWDGELAGSPNVNNVGWGNYELYDVAILDLTAGTHTLRLSWPVGDANVAAFVFAEGDVYAVAPPPAPAPAAEVVEPAAVVVAPVAEIADAAVAAEAAAETVADAVVADTVKPNPKSGDSLLFPVILVVLLGAAFVTARKVRVR